jgi:hypothetical protein
MPILHADFDPPEACPHAFAGDTSDVVYFLSFAFSARYLPDRQAGGSTHELSRASLPLRGESKIELRPHLSFTSRGVEEASDERDLAPTPQWAAERGAKVRLTFEL